jgi:hypothetical protein
MASGQLPPPLSPFHSPSGIFIPVIVRAEIVDRELAEKFATVRVDEQLYERRLVMFNYIPGMRWSDVRNVLVASAEWPLDVVVFLVSEQARWLTERNIQAGSGLVMVSFVQLTASFVAVVVISGSPARFAVGPLLATYWILLSVDLS